jgi:hypothetical protein
MMSLAAAATAGWGCRGVRSQLECPANRTELDGVCVSESVADYVSCVRAQGAQLNQSDANKLSAEAGYAGTRASMATEVSASLEKKYAASDANTLEIIRACTSIHASTSAAPEPSEPGWVRQGPFGAIAVSDGSGHFGWAIERATAAAAKAAAIGNCKADDCYIVVALEGACGAVAKGADGVEYWGRQPTRFEAERRAMRECEAKTTDCKPVAWSCSF